MENRRKIESGEDLRALKEKTTVSMVLFEGFEMLDVFGPLEMFGLLSELRPEVELQLVASAVGPVPSVHGPAAVAEVALEAVAATDLLLVPGGRGTRRQVRNTPFLEQIRRLATSAELVGSICTGAAILARADLLDGRQATTNKLAYTFVQAMGREVNWVPQARWVEDGKFFTAAGVSAGMDMALAMIAMRCGAETAEKVAQMAEYDWHRQADWDPFAKTAGLVD